MAEAVQSPYLARFESFEANLRTGELCKNGERIQLQEQSFQILSMLLERPGEVVLRQEIQRKLWPNDTVVEFDNSINAAIRRLRSALDDSADQPKFVETLARRGYRWKVPVEWVVPTGSKLQEPPPAVADSSKDSSASHLIGKRVSHYRVLEVLGGGGMGLVYKAEDLKLGRRVALKFLPEELANNAVARDRFEREARTASALNHPNICTIHEVEEYEGQLFIVMELLEGRTLRELISAGEPSRFETGDRKRCLVPETWFKIAAQIVEGLDAAHKKGVIHRDIKPANIFVTTQGQVKILDFGLAKLQLSEPVVLRPTTSNADQAKQGLDLTLTGVAMGTAGYMSPEQVRGEKLDPRTDLFSLGLVLYEMASGERAFTGETAPAIYDAILNQRPKAVRDLNPEISLKLESIINKALEKDLKLRYQSASEIRADLQSEAVTSRRIGSAGSHAARETSSSSVASKSLLLLQRFRMHPWYGVLAVAALAIVAIGLVLGGKRATVSSQPALHRLTFLAGTVLGARFVPQGHMVVYGASWEGNPIQVFLTGPDSSGSRELGYKRANILAISSAGELALALHKSPFFGDLEDGTLARVPLTSSEAPHEVAEHVKFADWSRGGSLAIVSTGGDYQLEFPLGKVLYKNQKTIYYPRVSPDERLVAFREDQDGVWALVVVDQTGLRRTLSRGWRNLAGLAWRPSGKEIWLAAREFGSPWGVYSVALSGERRLVWQIPGPLRLHDISSDGSVLLSKDSPQRGIKCLAPGDSQERDLSWLDGSQLADMSLDGRLVLFTEFGESASAHECEFCGTVYLRKTDGSVPVRLGEGTGLAISPDQQWALLAEDNFRRLVAVPIGPGEPKVLTHKPMRYWFARWFADGNRIAFTGSEPGHKPRIYVQELTKEAQPLSAEGVDIVIPIPSPDGKYVAGSLADRPSIWDVEGRAPRIVPHTLNDEDVWGWSSDSRFLFVGNLDGVPAEVYRVDATTGKRTSWKKLAPLDRAGIEFLNEFHPTADERGYAYSYKRTLSELYLVTGLK